MGQEYMLEDFELGLKRVLVEVALEEEVEVEVVK